MKRRTRVSSAVCACVSGAAVLGYWAYGKIVIRAVEGTFEAFGLHPKTSESLIFGMLPYMGGVLIVAGLALLLVPVVRRKLTKTTS